MFEAERGTSTAFIVALGFILISHGTCQGKTKPQVPERGPCSRMTISWASLRELLKMQVLFCVESSRSFVSYILPTRTFPAPSECLLE